MYKYNVTSTLSHTLARARVRVGGNKVTYIGIHTRAYYVLKLCRLLPRDVYALFTLRADYDGVEREYNRSTGVGTRNGATATELARRLRRACRLGRDEEPRARVLSCDDRAVCV